MTVAIEKGLSKIKTALTLKGYNVVELGSVSYPVSAVIYLRNDSTDMLDAANFNGYSVYSDHPYGVLMVNAMGKSIDDIDRILKSRLYSPLF